MSYHKRVAIFLFTMVATGVILIAIFVHSTTQALESLGASSVPLPTLGAQGQQNLQNLLHQLDVKSVKQGIQSTNTPPPASPQGQNTQNAGQENSGVATPDVIQEIPAKAMQ